jgi:hypothetical protein
MSQAHWDHRHPGAGSGSSIRTSAPKIRPPAASAPPRGLAATPHPHARVSGPRDCPHSRSPAARCPGTPRVSTSHKRPLQDLGHARILRPNEATQDSPGQSPSVRCPTHKTSPRSEMAYRSNATPVTNSHKSPPAAPLGRMIVGLGAPRFRCAQPLLACSRAPRCGRRTHRMVFAAVSLPEFAASDELPKPALSAQETSR